MTNDPAPDNDYFVQHFHDRAALAEELHERRFGVDANIIATTALDALGEVWFHDFPDERAALEQEIGGKVPASIRMARLVKRFGLGAPHIGKVAVVLFAEDLKRNVARAASEAEALLASRRPTRPGELPHALLDVAADELLRECPSLSALPRLLALIEEYEYPALLYRFVRSPFVHFGTGSAHTHGFARGDEVFYMRVGNRTAFGISLGVVTAWLRATVTNYVAYCRLRGLRPATDIDPARPAEDALDSRWDRVNAAGGTGSTVASVPSSTPTVTGESRTTATAPSTL